jgi:hypothetical protein
MITVNNKILCEAYGGGKGLKAEVKSGFATVQQKNNLVSLVTLAAAVVKNGDKTLEIPAGSKLYFSEEILYLHQQYHTVLKNELFQQPTVLADFGHVVGFEFPKEKGKV